MARRKKNLWRLRPQLYEKPNANRAKTAFFIVQQRRSRDTEEEGTQAVILVLQHSFTAIVLVVAFWLALRHESHVFLRTVRIHVYKLRLRCKIHIDSSTEFASLPEPTETLECKNLFDDLARPGLPSLTLC